MPVKRSSIYSSSSLWDISHSVFHEESGCCCTWITTPSLKSQKGGKEQNPSRSSWERLLRTVCSKWKCCNTWTDALNPCKKKKKRGHEGGSGQDGAFSCRARTSLSLEKQISVQLAKWYRDTASGRRNNSAECGFYSAATRSASFLHL